VAADREGSTLSQYLREAFDGKRLQDCLPFLAGLYPLSTAGGSLSNVVQPPHEQAGETQLLEGLLVAQRAEEFVRVRIPQPAHRTHEQKAVTGLDIAARLGGDVAQL
jgi:hypothetical protein